MADAKDLRVGKESSSRIQGQVVSIIVGSKKQLFHVHEVLLTSSDFFSRHLAACKTTQGLQLELWGSSTEAAATFAMYVHYIYFGTLPCKVEGKTGNPASRQINAEQLAVLRLYLMAQMLGDYGAMDATMNAFLVVSQQPHVDDQGGNFR